MTEVPGDNTVANLKARIAKIQAVEAEIEEKKTVIREFYKAAKQEGLDTKVMRKMVRELKMEPDLLAVELSTSNSYRHALGILGDTPLGQAALVAAGIEPAPPPPTENVIDAEAAFS